MNASRLDDLLDRYLLRHLDQAEQAELEEVLRNDASARRQFVERVLLEAHLYRACSDAGKAAEAAEARQVRTEQPPATGAGVPVRRAGWWRWAAVAAAALLAVGAGLLLVLWPTSPQAEVLSGSVLVNEVRGTRIPPGATIKVVGESPAVVRLTDGSRAELEPSTEVVFRKSDEARQVLGLVAGGGKFNVTRGGGQFRIETDIGAVTVVGTEFSVKLLAASGRDSEAARVTAGKMALSVSVASGVVQVEFAGQTYTLREGQNRRFTPEGDRSPKQVSYSGLLTRIDGGAITILRKREKAEETRTFAVDEDTKVLIETDRMESVPGEGGKMKQRPTVVDGQLPDLKVGRQVTVTCTEDGGKVVKVLVHRLPAPKIGKEKDKEGETSAPSQPRRGKEGD
jgi:ferric-dicitrate binding protein FerR (iron transport regulator)